MQDPTLTDAEIFNITHYKRAAEQLRELRSLGIPAKRRPDNTVCVLRVHLQQTPSTSEQPARPQLRTRAK